ncbi:MAG TPA: S9 family peptidase, partial [Candidatus Polarisedimenticolia bacterium]|nr:S9 family peptidase [Candidatus Polarisedimenticolia bacterium]
RDHTVVGRDERPRRLWVLDRATGRAEPVTALGERSAWEIAWSPDGATIAAAVTLRPTTEQSYLEKRLVALPLKPGSAEREIAPRVGKVRDVVWSRDGGSIAWLGGVDRRDPSFGSVFVAPAAGGTPRNLTGDRLESVRDILYASGSTIVVAAMQGTGSAIVALDTVAGTRRDILSAGRLAFLGGTASDDGTKFAVIGSTGATPEEIHVIDRRGARVLTNLNPAVAGLPRALQEVVSWRASDGVAIDGVLVRPLGDTKRASWPLVVMLHGGPEYEELDGWGSDYGHPAQALAERGFYVLRPNYRGSTGRGVAFAKSDQGDLGGRDFQDILDGIDALAGRYRFDKNRVGMAGESYGGYFANLAATRYSARFAAVVSRYGISDWISFLGQSDIPVENAEVHWALWCWERHEVCWQASPVAHIAKAATPILLMHGDADLRVPKAQSDELYTALRWTNAPVEYVVFPREAHGFDERAHRIETARRILEWFERYLTP